MNINSVVGNQAAQAVGGIIYTPSQNWDITSSHIGQNIEQVLDKSNLSFSNIATEWISSHTAGEDIKINTTKEIEPEGRY